MGRVRDILRDAKVTGFETSSAMPRSAEQAGEWQKLNRSWWQRHPMRYDVGEALQHEEFTREFYEEIDRRFYRSLSRIMPWRQLPFEELIDFSRLNTKDVLEIGVGTGIHAELLAPRSASYRGIDITDYAVTCSDRRLRRLGYPGTMYRMDAERLAFGDQSFDFVWSWGVIHHSADTSRALREIHRVLRGSGEAVVMVYHRSPWNLYVRGGLYYGLLKGMFFRGRTLTEVLQDATDGALARYYSRDEWLELTAGLFRVKEIRILGSATQLIPLPHGRIKEFITGLIPSKVSRYITNRPFFGFLMVTRLEKI